MNLLKGFTWFYIVLLSISLAYSEDEPACLSLSGCLKLTLNPQLFGVPPQGHCATEMAQIEEKHSTNLSTAPSTGSLVLLGLALAPVEFLLSTVIHEGSHAAAIGLFTDAEITAFKPYPHTTPKGRFLFGAVYWKDGTAPPQRKGEAPPIQRIGKTTPDQHAIIDVAPMVVDTTILGIYSALTATGNVPDNKFARMGMWVFASGHWIDMANHLASRNDHTDSAKLMKYLKNEHGFSTGAATMMVKGTQVAVLATSGYFMTKELIDIFQKGPRAELQPDIYVLPGTDGEQIGLVIGGRY